MSRAIVFDFGGVLLRWRPAELLRQALPQLATDEAATARLMASIFQGYGGEWAEFDRGTVDVDTLVQRIGARSGLAPRDVRAVVDAVPGELQPVAESVALLGRLRAERRPLYFLSNMPAPFADHLEAAHEFVGWFDDGVFSARVRAIKPEPAIFALAAERFGRAPGELLFIDDHLPNVEAARAAGWQALHFGGAEACEREMRALGWIG